MIVGFSGHAGAGKDTAAAVLVHRYGFRRLAFADNLKTAAKHIFGFSDDQLWGAKKDVVDPYWGVAPRFCLEKTGTECLRNGYADDVWIKSLFRTIADAPHENYVITDVRFPNEAQVVKDWGGRVIRIERDGLAKRDHISDRALADWPFDAYVRNNGSRHDLAVAVIETVLGRSAA